MLTVPFGTAETMAYGLCALVYLTVAVAGLAIRTTLKRRYFVGAALATVVWAAAVVATGQTAVSPLLPAFAESLRNAGWLVFLLTLWGRLDDARAVPPRRVLITRAFLPVLAVILAVSIPSYLSSRSLGAAAGSLLALINIVLPVVGLLFVENLLRTSGSTGRWAIKHLCLGLGTIMTLDFYVYSDALVEGALDENLIAARALVTALVAPLLVSSFHRLRNWRPQAELKLIASPKAAFYTMALIASGVYLLAMAAIAYYIRVVGGQWGGPLQVTFLVASLIIMLAIFASSQLKSRAKLFILKNFFSYKYDYREEWLRFIQIMSAEQPLALGFRLVRAIADLMDSPAGALWVLQAQDDCYFADAIWNLPSPHPPMPADNPLVAFLTRSCRVIDIDEWRRFPQRYEALELPGWIAERPAIWLIVPLVHRGQLLGFVLLNQARAPHPLDWEDTDLLNTAAIQAASYLAEELTAEELRAARRLEDFNRQFAFVVHDIKNVVGQMSLMLENAKKFGDNPDFQKDMFDTVSNSVTRMRALLEQLAAQRRQPAAPAPLDLKALLARLAESRTRTAPNLKTDLPVAPVTAVASETALTSVIELLLDNALQATGPGGNVLLRLREADEQAIMEVIDDGPGMDETFVTKELFRPLASTKSAGYGIGAYQTRYLVREMGAKLEVDTAPQKGTTMRIVLPKSRMPSKSAENDSVVR